MRNVDVCLSPELLHLYDIKGKVVVVVDVLRATSVMVTATANGITEIVPVSEISACCDLLKKGYIGAAERNGQTAEGFSYGNSPFSYMGDAIKGKKLAITTTNGTLSINKAKGADQVIIGSFLNKSAVISYLRDQEKDVLVLCAGWKGRVNLEDTLFAGAVVEGLNDDFRCEHDGSIAAHSIYKIAQHDLLGFLSNCSHFRRLSKLNISKDIEFCLKQDVYDVVPVLEGDKIVSSNKVKAGVEVVK